jgi:hypothetical protein
MPSRQLIALRWLATAALLAPVVAHRSSAQSTRRDTTRTIIIDSVRKVYGVTLPSRASASVASDLTRTVDAEVRVAMFELTSGDEFAALSRLERVSALVQDSSGAGLPERSALHFLLSQTYYRLGMLAPFRREAEASLASGQTRYADVLRPQLLVEAYRSGDYQRAGTLARDLPTSDANGLGSLVAGLAAYQSGDLPAARAAYGRGASAD